MPVKKKSTSKTAKKRKIGVHKLSSAVGTGARRARKKAGGAGKSAAKATAGARKAITKVASGVRKEASKVAANPRRTVRKAAENVHHTAGRARAMGESVVTAGELLKETADFVDSMAERAKSRSQQARGTSRKRR